MICQRLSILQGGGKKPLKKPDWTSQQSLIDGTINGVAWEDLDDPLLGRCMAENQGWGLDDLKMKILDYQQVTRGITPDPDDRAYEVVPPPPLVEDSEIDDCISELPSSIHSDANEHDAFYVRTVVEEVELEVNDPISAAEATLFSLNDIEEKEPQRHTTCCMAKPSSSSRPFGKPTRRRYVNG